jgi:DNA-directed RNA polymerase beta' subunit
MHLPQNLLAETELRHLAAIPYQLISPRSNSPIIGIFQDSMLGSFLYTREKLLFEPRFAMNLLMMFPDVNVQELQESMKRNGGKISNFDILSQILPPFSIEYKTDLFDKDKEKAETSNNILEIRNGKYVRGQIIKSVINGGSKGIIHRINNDFGNETATKFIDNYQNIITEYMKSHAYSVGVSDLIANQQTYTEIAKQIDIKKNEVQDIISEVHLGIFKNITANSSIVEFESRIHNLLNKAREATSEIAKKSLNKSNRFVQIVTSGSKGSVVNITQMIACLGQQDVDGKRIPYGLDSRTLPHFSKFDDGANARGFIENSYISGLTSQELFFHAMAGRIGLIDTAVKSVTWETPIVVIEKGQPKYTEIGKWIDGQLDMAIPENIQHFKERNMELMNLPNDQVYIPTTDEDGKVTWGEVTAITRHDPGEVLYEIKTSGGRKVIVTESKSLLIWNAETKKLVETLTPEIVIGDCVPVTGELCCPPILLETIDMSKYLPKTEYIYGTEFNTALDMMNKSMEGKYKISQGWWNENNGNKFTLPYTKKSSLQRTSVRSCLENIENGYIYPYHANRKETMIPEKFELNEENGIFIGLFLSEGNVHKNTISITNLNENIKIFVKSWFDKHSISWTEKTRLSKIGSTSTSIIGNSSILSTFLNKLVGSGAEHKYVPTEAFISKEEFIIGILNGYFSGDGTISKNSIEVGSASYRLIEGITMLCSRLGIFGKMFKTQLKSNNLGTKNIKPTYRLSIRAQWGKKFSDKITLLEETKNKKMKEIEWGTSHRNFNTYNNIVLDTIIEINLVDVKDHPKVYDLTIPTTLNFGLANGLQVRDTSTTGYIQRRLIKGLEDLKVEYDMTVRNSIGKIVQFRYGGDGFDSTKVEGQNIGLVSQTISDIYSHYQILGVNIEKGDLDQADEEKLESNLLSVYSKGAVSRCKKQVDEAKKRCKEIIDMMITARNDLVVKVFKNKNENKINTPIGFAYLISNIQGQLDLNDNHVVDITPLEALQLMDEYFEKIKKMVYSPPTELFKIMYYYYLSPKDILIKKRFHKKALTLLLETILLKYKQAIVHPGEMVGIVAGQSLGEPTTQLTLNSVSFETEIVIKDSLGKIKKVQIGEFIEKNIKQSKKIDYMEEKDTTYAELNEYWEVPSSNKMGQTVWRRIEAVTKHPVINEDGTNTMLKIITKGNREVYVTKAKSLLQLIDGEIQAVNGKDLKIGDYLPCSIKPLEYIEQFELDLKEILPPTEYVYGSELQKAKQVYKEKFWWKKYANKSFVLPHTRSDSVVRLINIENNIQSGFVYMKLSNICEYRISEKIELDYDFGYLLGAYCAEGCMTKHQLSISNNDTDYFEPIIRWCEKHNLTTKIYRNENKNQTGWTSQDLRIYNTIMCRIISDLCGKLSHNKYVSDKIVFSNRQCILGFLDAYIGGDGCVNQSPNKNLINEIGKRKCVDISAHSVSYKMLLDIQVMLKNLGIISKIHKKTKQETNNRGSINLKQPYEITIRNNQAKKLASILNIKLKDKQEKVQRLLNETKFKFEIDEAYLTIPNIINGKLIMQSRNGKLCEDLIFDPIVSIEDVPNTTLYAYDLTVEDTRTFDCYNGVNFYDTFHLSGVSSKSNVTRGVPRIEEIIRLTENPKNPSMTVYLRELDRENQEKAKFFSTILEHTRLVDIVQSMQICFDPTDENTKIPEDRHLIQQFYEFERQMLNTEHVENLNVQAKSKWIVRLTLNREVMLEKNITMDDVHFAIKKSHEGSEIQCVFSDYNMENLVFRLRIHSSIFKKTKRAGFAKSLDVSDEIYLLKNFQDSLLNNIVLRGVTGVENVIPRKLATTFVDKKDGQFTIINDKENAIVKKDLWILDTTGTNLLDTLALDFIDPTRTFSNDIREVFDVLGIEAARQMIYNEFNDVMEFSGVYINYHHLSLLCDRMTSTKKMTPIFRSGILNDNIGPIAKATFEVHTEVLLDASRHAQFDHMRGISANVMCGQYGYYGTNAFNVLLDLKKLTTEKKLTLSNTTEEIEKSLGNVDEEKCGLDSIRIITDINNIKQGNFVKTCNDDDFNVGF